MVKILRFNLLLFNLSKLPNSYEIVVSNKQRDHGPRYFLRCSMSKK